MWSPSRDIAAVLFVASFEVRSQEVNPLEVCPYETDARYFFNAYRRF